MGLNNSQYNAIMREYDRKQAVNKYNLDQRIAKIYKAVPQLEELDSSIGSMAVARARKILEGDKTALEKLKEDFRDLEEQRSILLASGGFSREDMEMKYHCDDCKDTGYKDNRKCHCFKQAVIELLYTQSNLKQILMRENFRTFSYDYFSSSQVVPELGISQLDYMHQVVEKCWNFIESFDVAFKNVLFTGTTGVGKTFLSNCIADELIRRCHSVIYLSASELFDIFSKNKFDFELQENMEEMYQYILDCDLLIIDDLGTELTNTFTTSQLFYCINERILRKKSVIVSTNLSMNMLRDIYSERVTSRMISEYEVIKLLGEDIRIQKKIREV